MPAADEVALYSIQNSYLIHYGKDAMTSLQYPIEKFAEVPNRYRFFEYERHWSLGCKHQHLDGRWYLTPTGLKRAKMQCLSCGVGVGSQLPTSNGETYASWDTVLEQRIKQQRDAHEKHEQLRRNSWQEQVDREWFEVYNKYLQSRVWKLKRLAVLNRAGCRCECCGTNDAVQVHHTKYPKDYFGLEPLWDLRAVCLDCHRVIHPHMD